MTNQLRAELRKIFSTRLWWGLLIPVAVLSMLLGVFGGLVGAGLGAPPGGDEQVPIVLASVAYALATTTVFAALHGIVATAGEFRHRTITTTYLSARGRGTVLAVKAGGSAAVGGLYATVTVVVGVVAGLLGQSGGQVPPGPLVAVAAIGVLVCALWGAVGAALGMVVSNQATVIALTLVYLLLAENLLSLFLTSRDPPAVAALSAFLPVAAGEAALYDVPARTIAGPQLGPEIVAGLTTISEPLSLGGSLAVLAVWTALAVAAGWAVGGRRDIT